jgi:hypothetical protein
MSTSDRVPVQVARGRSLFGVTDHECPAIAVPDDRRIRRAARLAVTRASNTFINHSVAFYGDLRLVKAP